MSETMLLGILAIFFTPVFGSLGWILRQNIGIGKRLDILNGTVARHEKVYRACPFCPDKDNGKS